MNDQTKAAAILAAQKWLDDKNCNYNPTHIGTRAKEILDALEGTQELVSALRAVVNEADRETAAFKNARDILAEYKQ